MHMPKLILLTLTALLLLVGCQQPQTNTQVIKETKASSAQQAKVAQAFNEASDLQEKHSKWFNRTEKLPLTIIATAFIDPEATKTKEYKAYKKLVKKISKDISLLGNDIASKYSSIKFVDYNSNNSAKEKFTASYTNKYSDKDKLTDILRPDVEKPSQELLIRLNLKELEKGNLTIEGYKTVKQSHMSRNSYYYTLRKLDYKKLNKKEKNEAIINSLKAVLQLSIPEYVSIDRTKLVNDGEVLRFITPQEDGTYTGEVWKYQTNSEVKKLNADLDNIYRNSKSFGKIVDNHYQIGKNNYGFRVANIKEHSNLFLHIGALLSSATSSDGKFRLYGNVSSKNVGAEDISLKYEDLKNDKNTRYLKGHASNVNSVDISKDGRYALSSDENSNLKYWDLKTGKLLRTISSLSDIFSSRTFGDITTGDTTIAKMSDDGKFGVNIVNDTLRYWNLKTGKLLNTISLEQAIDTVAISPDGKYAATSAQNIKYWDLKTGALLQEISDKASGLALSPDNHYLTDGSSYWDLKSGNKLKTFTNGISNGLSFSTDGKYLYNKEKLRKLTFSKKDTRKIKKIKKQIEYIKKSKSYIEVQEHQNLLTTPLVNSDIKVLLNSDYIHQYNTLNLQVINKISRSMDYQYDDSILNMFFTNSYANYTKCKVQMIEKAMLIQKRDTYNLDEIYFSSNLNLKEAGYIKINSLNNLDVKFTSEQFIDGGDFDAFLAISNDGKHLLIGRNAGIVAFEVVVPFGGTLRYIELKTGKVIHALDLEEQYHDVSAVAITPNGKYALSVTEDSIRYLDLKTAKTLKVFSDGELRDTVSISKNGNYALTSNVYIDLKKGSILKRFKWKTFYMISPDGKHGIYTQPMQYRNGSPLSSEPPKLKYMNLKTGKIVKTFQGQTAYIKDALISKDGKYVVAVTSDLNRPTNILYWEIKSAKLIKTITISSIDKIAISNDGKYLLAGSLDGIHYINLKTGKLIKILKGHTNEIKSLIFTPDGKYAISSSSDKTIRYWSLDMALLNADY